MTETTTITTDQDEFKELSDWFSTYGLITADRILSRYKIKLSPDELKQAMKTIDDPHHKLLKIPLHNVMNGIILQQVKDYQIYAQKLFIDYLLSGESGKPDASPGANIRKDLETQRLKLIKLSEALEALEYDHLQIISESQRTIKPLVESIRQGNPFPQSLEELQTKIKPISDQLYQFRTNLYNLILKATELLQNLPDYRMDIDKIKTHKEGLNFDRSLGEEGINPKDLD